MDLRLDASTNKLLAATHGRGMFTTPALTTTRTLTVTKSGNGGRVTSAPAGIDCGSTCTHAFFEGAQVVLTAPPDYGWSFGGWSGACANAIGTCTVAMDADKALTATFTKNKYSLAVAMNGDGSGTVSSSPAGISCNPACGSDFEYGTAVTLTAVSDVYSRFAGWSGACSDTGACTVTMDAAKSVTATFDQKPCVVPNVKRKTLAPARAAIKRANCSVGRVHSKYSNSVKKGRVLSQSPRAGRTLGNGAKVNLTLSRGRRPGRH